ncbi:MAG TPA: class I SAM-dependent methyltransferase [Vicinamibacterales bacterium]
MSLILDEHREYLGDTHRLAAFSAAVAATVRPGAVVLDLGSGTGILSLLACRAGAARVYAVEFDAIIGLTRDICRDNGFADRVHFIHELSTRAALPERVDVVLTDQIGRFGFDAGLLAYLPDARARMLREDGVTIPRRLDLWIAPVTCPDGWARAAFWRTHPCGFELGAAARLARNTVYPVSLRSDQLLGAAQRLASVDPSVACDVIAGAVEMTIAAAGTLHGIGGWFSAELAPGISMTNDPLAPDRIARRQAWFPIDEPIDAKPGDRVRATVHIRPLDMVVSWHVRVERPGGTRSPQLGDFRHSTFGGMLMAPELLARTRPDAQPTLSPAGEARRSVLELCDGGRTVAEIEAEVWRRHEPLFGSPDRAAAFVAEVITRYGR